MKLARQFLDYIERYYLSIIKNTLKTQSITIEKQNKVQRTLETKLKIEIKDIELDNEFDLQKVKRSNIENTNIN